MRRGVFFAAILFLLPAISFASTTFSRPLVVGSQGSDVSSLQQILKDKGYFMYPTVTGLYGAFTYRAVATFQKANNLEQVGTVGPKTRALLNTALTVVSSSSSPAAPSIVSTSTPYWPGSTTPLPGYAPGQIIFGGGGGPSTPTPDTTAPSVSFATPSNAATVGGSAVSLVVGVSDNVAVASVQFKVDNANIGASVTTSPYVTAWNSTGVADGVHTLAAVAADTSGNLSTSSISVTVDNTAPVISSIATTSVATTSARVIWTTNESANSKVVYGTTASYGLSSSNATLSTSHSITLSGLIASTTYHFAVVSADSVGNTSTSSDKLFTTQTGLLSVNISGPEFAPWNGQRFPNSADFSYLASKGVTSVRMPIAWEGIQTSLNGALDSTYLGKIQTALANAAANNIKIIVDLHNFGAYCDQAHWVSSGCGYAGNAGSTGTGVSFLGDGTLSQSNFTDVWTKLATALAGNAGLLGYDIMNEPSIKLTQYSTNLLFAPNGFGDTVGSQPWFITNGAVVTQLANGTNPLGSNYGPAWSLTSGTGFGSVAQTLTLSNVPYTLSVYCKVTSGSDTNFVLDIGASNNSHTCTTSWQRFSLTATPSAGSVNVQVQANEASGHTFIIANAQLEVGSSASTYQPNPWLNYAQAAINAVRAVDTNAPIYINGFNGTAYLWPWENWDLATLTGGNLIFEAHQYFDGAVSSGGGGGVYSGNYSSYSNTSNAGVSEVVPFESWLASTSLSGYIGEYGVPDNSKSDQSSWLALQDNFLQSLIANNIPSSLWFYASGIQSSNILNIATSTTLNAGNDDQRLLRMLLQY